MRLVAEDILYIGTDDLDLDLFESQYPVPEGMSYNSYLIDDEKIAVLDTVDARRGTEWLANLEAALSGRTPDYLVVHHMEPDHSSMISAFLDKYPSATVLASAKAIQMLELFFPGKDFSGRTKAVAEGETVTLGKHALTFIAAPMVHWPEVVTSFDPATGTLFSADAFGKFGALSKCGYFGEDEDDWACEARRYYFNICGKYGVPVQTLLKKISALDVKAIAPLHGPVLRKDIGKYLGLYDIWSRYGAEKEGVLVAYASIHGCTAEAALAIGDMIRSREVKVKMMDVTRIEASEAVEDAFSYGKVILAASTYDGGLFPPMANFLHHLRDKAWQNRKVGLIENGSWAPAAARMMKELLSTLKATDVSEPVVTLRGRLKDSDRPALEALADAILK